MGRRRKNLQDFVDLPAWLKGRGDSESEASEASGAGSGDEEVPEIPSSQPSWDIAGWQLPESQESLAAAALEADE